MRGSGTLLSHFFKKQFSVRREEGLLGFLLSLVRPCGSICDCGAEKLVWVQAWHSRELAGGREIDFNNAGIREKRGCFPNSGVGNRHNPLRVDSVLFVIAPRRLRGKARVPGIPLGPQHMARAATCNEQGKECECCDAFFHLLLSNAPPHDFERSENIMQAVVRHLSTACIP